MFCRCFSILLLILLIFASTSNAFTTSGCAAWDQKQKYNKMSNGLACIDGYKVDAKQEMICSNDNGCKCWIEEDETEVECDKMVKKSVMDCETYAQFSGEPLKIVFPETARKIVKEICPSTGKGADKKDENGANNNGADNNGADNNGANNNGADNNGADKKSDNGAETIGSGFTLLMVSLVASFFL